MKQSNKNDEGAGSVNWGESFDEANPLGGWALTLRGWREMGDYSLNKKKVSKWRHGGKKEQEWGTLE